MQGEKERDQKKKYHFVEAGCGGCWEGERCFWYFYCWVAKGVMEKLWGFVEFRGFLGKHADFRRTHDSVEPIRIGLPERVTHSFGNQGPIFLAVEFSQQNHFPNTLSQKKKVLLSLSNSQTSSLFPKVILQTSFPVQ